MKCAWSGNITFYLETGRKTRHDRHALYCSVASQDRYHIFTENEHLLFLSCN